MPNNNSSHKKLLTIAIPAYGRPDDLEKLIKQFQNENTEIFTIIICDDASPNDLSNMVKPYLEKMPNLQFIRNEINLGFSGNVCKLYDLAKTDFIWFVCDDDSIIPGCVDKIVDSIIKYDPTVAVFNHIWVNPYGTESTAGVAKDYIYEDLSEINDYGCLLRTTFLSTLVLKKILPSDEVRKTDYKSNVFIQVTFALMLLSKKFKFVEISTPIIYRHVGFKYGEFFKFYIVDHLRAVHAIKHKLDNKKFINWSIREIPTSFKLYMSQKLGLFKYRGIISKRTVKEIFKYYGVYAPLIFLFVPVYFIVPGFILKAIYKFQLQLSHGKQQAQEIYNKNINRAYKDNRQTGFTEYR